MKNRYVRKELKRLRVSNFLSQEQMAKRCNVSRNNYSYIERGERDGSADFWFTLQDKFNVPMEQLIEMRRISEVKQ